jgi:hypothetical protein
MNVNESIDDCRSVNGWESELSVRDRERRGSGILSDVEIESVGEFETDLVESLIRPISKPVEDTAIEESWRGCCTRSESARRRIHRENDVEVASDLRCEPSVEFLGRVEHESISLSPFLARRHQCRMLVSFEESWNFGVRKESVHSFEESRVENVRFVHDEGDLLSFATCSSEDSSEIVVEIFPSVLVVNVDLEDAETVHPCDEP